MQRGTWVGGRGRGMMLAKSKICRVGWQIGDPGEDLMLSFKSEGYQMAEFLLVQEGQTLFYSGF